MEALLKHFPKLKHRSSFKNSEVNKLFYRWSFFKYKWLFVQGMVTRQFPSLLPSSEIFALVPLPKNDFPQSPQDWLFSSFRSEFKCHLGEALLIASPQPVSISPLMAMLTSEEHVCLLPISQLSNMSYVLHVLFDIVSLASGIVLNIVATKYTLLNK